MVRVHAQQQLTGAQHTLRAGIVRDDRELFHQIIIQYYSIKTLTIVKLSKKTNLPKLRATAEDCRIYTGNQFINIDDL